MYIANFVRVTINHVDDSRKARCIRVHAHGFWEVSLFSITSDNEGAESCNCLLATFGSDEGIFCILSFNTSLSF